MTKLKGKRAMFAKEYLVDLNATQAALRAGYAPRSARQQAQRLMTNVDILTAINAGMARRSKAIEIKAADVLAELGKLAFSNVLDFMRPDGNGGMVVDLEAITRDQAAAISEVTVEQTAPAREEGTDTPATPAMMKIKLKLADKRAPLELVGKHLGMFSDKLEVDLKVGVHAMDDDALVAHARQVAARLGVELPRNLLTSTGRKDHSHVRHFKVRAREFVHLLLQALRLDGCPWAKQEARSMRRRLIML